MASNSLSWPLLDVAPRTASLGGSFAWGRYRRPLLMPDTGRGAAPWQLKQWCYQAVVTEQLFVAVGVVQLGYVAQLFAYLVDRATGAKHELERLAPLGLGLRFADSSIAGETRFVLPDVEARLGFDQGFRAQLALPWGSERLLADWTCFEDDAMALLFPLPGGKPAYTHKASGMRVAGALSIGDRTWSLDGGLGSLDWTRAQAERHTRWKWASMCGRAANGARLGLNLSAEVYDAEGASQENALWIDGRALPLGPVRFELPAQSAAGFKIESLHGPAEAQLVLEPLGERRHTRDFGLVRSSFVQAYGRFVGRLRGQAVEGFGVIEDHDSLW